jgi:hypothetical protein
MSQEMMRGAAIAVVGGLLSICGAWAISANAQRQLSAQLVEQRAVITHLEARIETLEALRHRAVSAPPTPQARVERPTKVAVTPGVAPGVAPSAAPLDPMDPDVQPQVREAVQGMVRDELAIEREERRIKRADRLKARVREEVAEFARSASLDKEGEAALAGYIAAEREEMMKLWEDARDAGLEPDEMRKKMEALRAATDQEVALILDEDQYKLYSEQRAEEVARFTQGRGPRGGGQRGGGQRGGGQRGGQR